VSRKLPALKPKEFVRVLLKVGFRVDTQKGSHVQLEHGSKSLKVTVPFHSGFDLPPEIVHSILKQAQISRDEFLELLRK